MKTGGMGKLLSMDARGKLGWSGGFGRIRFGYNKFGYYNWYAGIYSKKHQWGKTYISRMKFYRPTNPNSVGQQARRTAFANGMSAWASLSTDQKNIYKRRAKPYKMNGSNLFMKEYLNTH